MWVSGIVQFSPGPVGIFWVDSCALAGAGDIADRVTAINASTTNTLLNRLAG